MRIAINVVLIIIIGAVLYMLYDSIKEPVIFKNVKEAREDQIRLHFDDLGKAMEAYRAIKGDWATSFDDLENVLKTDSFVIEKTIGDPDNPNAQVIKQKVVIPAIDSINNSLTHVKLEDLRYVPFTEKKTQFDFKIDSIMQQGVMLKFYEISVRVGEYMGELYDDKDFSIYDRNYDPDKLRIKTSRR